jgi:hypothetical protein
MEINDNIRAEIARRRTTAQHAYQAIRSAYPAVLHMSASTWTRRMQKPSGWTIGELDDLAAFLKCERSRLTG